MANFSNIKTTHDEACELIEACERYNNLYKKCQQGAMLGSRCSSAEKMIIKLLLNINDKLDSIIQVLKS